MPCGWAPPPVQPCGITGVDLLRLLTAFDCGTFPRLTQSHRPHRLSVSRWHPIEGLISCDLRLAEPARSSLRYVFGNDKRRSTDRSSGWR